MSRYLNSKQRWFFLVAIAALGLLSLNWSYVLIQLRYLAQGRPELVPVEQVPALECLPPNRLKITSLGIEAPVVYVEESSEAAFQAGLQNGIVHFPGTALPGEPGNTYIFGHSSDYVWSSGEYKTVFALLPKIQPGDLIQISGADGRLFTYSVTGTIIVAPNETWVLDQYQKQVRMLTLQTSYPLGTAFRRFIVQAKLIAEEPRCVSESTGYEL